MKIFKIGDIVRRINHSNWKDLEEIKIGTVGIVINVGEPFYDFVTVKYFNGITVTNEETNLELVEKEENVIN